MPPQGAAARCRCQSAVWVMELGCFAAAGVPLQGAASRCCRVLFALWSLVAGALQPLLVLLQWQASPGVQGAKLLFIFPLRFQDQKGLGGLVCLSASFRPRLGLVLASFWLRLFLLMLRLRWCCEQHRQHKQQKQQKEQCTTGACAGAGAACATAGAASAAGAACAACAAASGPSGPAGAACAASTAASAACAAFAAASAAAAAAPAASAASSAAAGPDRHRIATLRSQGKRVS